MYKIVTANAPINIAIIKYWGKFDEHLKIPLNDSISGTLSLTDLSATTSAALSDKFKEDKLWLNDIEVPLNNSSPAKRLLDEIRHLSKQENDEQEITDLKVHIVSRNNFPTAAGLASSAAGYACLAFVLGNLYNITDPVKLSILARKGSGSACRSLFGGFVRWHKGVDSNTSYAKQLVGPKYWPEMRVIICVVSDAKKGVSSSQGMRNSVETSNLLTYRAERVVPDRVEQMEAAIFDKDFEKFAEITMQDSNQFHAVCLDTWPPIFYLDETSKAIINFCALYNSIYSCNKVAYTFDAGPNACIYLLEESVDEFLTLLEEFFPNNDGNLLVKGAQYTRLPLNKTIFAHLNEIGLARKPNSLKYIINTSIGDGPKLTDNHIIDRQLEV